MSWQENETGFALPEVPGVGNSTHFCHECARSVRPSNPTAPTPTCPLCHGEFLEEIEGASDDPRQFDAPGPFAMFNTPSGGPEGEPSDNETPTHPFGALLQHFFSMAGAPDSARPAQPATPAGNENSPTRTSSDPRRAAADAAERRARGEPLQPAADDATATTTRTATFTFENGRGVTMHGTLDGDGSRDGAPVPVRQLSDFLAGAFGAPAADPSAPGEQGERRTDQPTSFSEQLLAMLGIRAEGGAFRSEGSGFQFYFGGGGRMGQFGDYVSEQGLQNVLTELMEQAQGQHGPAPATEEVIAELPRCKLTTEMLAHDTMTSCPICQDDFQIDEMAIKLPKPCNHVFHQDCLTPWLKTSGTCPVCRYELVPQPSHARPDSGGPHTPRSPAVPNEHRPASLSPVVEGSRLPGEFPFFQGAIRPPAPGPRPPQNLPPQDDVD